MRYLFAILINTFLFMTTTQATGNYATINGMKMYYEEYGKGEALVLIHGGGSTVGTNWGRVINDFARNHHVIAVELQAHGHTEDRGTPTSFEQDADDVSALLKHLKIDKADIFGFSNGASTTLQLAIRHPKQVNKIIVASTFYKKTGAQPWFWGMMEKASFDGMPQPYKDAFKAINPSADALYTMYKRDTDRMLNFKDISDADMKSIQAPALVVSGDNDVATPEHMVEMYRILPHAQLAIFPGGHGDYIGELFTLKPDAPKHYPAVDIIEAFLKGK